LTTGPPGLASLAIFAMSFLSHLATGKPVAPPSARSTSRLARRDNKGEGDAQVSSSYRRDEQLTSPAAVEK
jgi:hypothetical protein